MGSQNPGWAFHPITKHASAAVRVVGPDQAEGQHWLIDGLKDGSPAGATYQITFEWSEKSGVKKVKWELVSEDPSEFPNKIMASAYAHKYHILGSWNAWAPQEMQVTTKEPSVHEASIRI